MKRVRVAVVGGGIFGATSAIELARHGFTVDLFEQNHDLLLGASGINQYRLHRGYHYPRSPETVESCLESESDFREMYASAIIDDVEHYYCIAKKGSRTSADEFVELCNVEGLELAESSCDLVRKAPIELCVRAKESLVDPEILRSDCRSKLRSLKVNVHLDTRADSRLLHSYDFMVVCTYSSLNEFLVDGFADTQQDYQFELCEKPVARLPKTFDHKSVVVMDGPFMCIDPFGRTGLFVLGNVVHAIHQTNVGKYPEIDEQYRSLLNVGVIENPPVTHFDRFISSAGEFFQDNVGEAEHIGSMFTIRSVLPYKDDTDERPTMVRQVGDRMVTIFSGKFGTSVQAAKQAVEKITEMI